MISAKYKEYLDPNYSVADIENFKEATLDPKGVWRLYHKNLLTGVGRITFKTLISVGKFYNVPANELIFLPK